MTAPKKTTKKHETQAAGKLSDAVKRKLSLLELALELGNVSKACELMGYHSKSRLPCWSATARTSAAATSKPHDPESS